MIYSEVVVAKGLVSEEVFLLGFAITQCLPGPLFNVATFIGAAVLGLRGALLASIGIFLPGTLLILGFLPFWMAIRKNVRVKAALSGVNAAAAGLINAALYVFMTKSIPNRAAFAVTMGSGLVSTVFKWSPPATIISGGIAGYVLYLLNIGGPF